MTRDVPPLAFLIRAGLLLVGILAVAALSALGVVGFRVKTEALANQVRQQENRLERAEQRLRALEGRIADQSQPAQLRRLAEKHALGLHEPAPGSLVRMDPRGYPGYEEPETRGDRFRVARARLRESSYSGRH
jgi:hypothetical protein